MHSKLRKFLIFSGSRARVRATSFSEPGFLASSRRASEPSRGSDPSLVVCAQVIFLCFCCPVCRDTNQSFDVARERKIFLRAHERTKWKENEFRKVESACRKNVSKVNNSTKFVVCCRLHTANTITKKKKEFNWSCTRHWSKANREDVGRYKSYREGRTWRRFLYACKEGTYCPRHAKNRKKQGKFLIPRNAYRAYFSL